MKFRQTTLAVPAIALMASAALAACGSSSSSTTSTTGSSGGSNAVAQTAYGKQLASFCSQAKKELSSNPPFPYPTFNPFHPDASKLPAIGRFFEKNSLPAFEKIAADVKKVKPTAAEKQHFEAFVRQLDLQVPDLKRQIAAAKSSDVSGFIATVKQLGASVSKLRAAQAALGVPACSGNI
jgi:hypothetical protein